MRRDLRVYLFYMSMARRFPGRRGVDESAGEVQGFPGLASRTEMETDWGGQVSPGLVRCCW